MFTRLNFKMPDFMKNLRLNELKYLFQIVKEKKNLVISILALFLFIAAIFRVLISPEIEKARNYQKELAFITSNSLALEKALVEHPDMDEEIEFLKKRREVLIQRSLGGGNFLVVAQKVIAELENYGVQISSFKYLYDLKEPLEAGYKKYGLQLELITDFSKLSKFLEDAEQKGIMFEIGRIKITKIDKGLLNVKLRIDFIIKEKA